MHIFISGATGLIGSALIERLLARGDKVTLLTRSIAKSKARFTNGVEAIDSIENLTDLDQFDAVINLAGEPIFAKRWNRRQKARLENSRIELTERLAYLINNGSTPPHTFISGSACGYYGDCGDNLTDENTPAADNFIANLCLNWEKAALAANCRVCLLRTGIVLSAAGGALAQMLPLYRLGLGAKLGGGRQFWAWIALQDMVEAILFLLEHNQCSGAFNLVSPCPVPQAEFNRTLGRLLNRPHFANVPGCILSIAFGERARILLDSQRIIPAKLLQQGFRFKFTHLHKGLEAALK
ncbi:TIGR01777 family oxidoreductase [Mesocricetibacter intestinalis]|uniref:TIGR01777 family oxidoreductase n=1 Tax=Mesocricetibacter intestinalis TaxID=1521930 RepID=UPI00105CC682|nr:TIGR01777 family oxidoreductase [Mesocricetibacter intestinalis]